MTLPAGTLLGPYEIVAFVGAGGMGDVYRAHDTRLERDVAIKILSAQLAGDATALVRFEREARTLSRLTHPNVCTVFDVGHDGPTHYIVMEFLEGRTLAAELAAGPLPIERGLEYAIQIADGLAKAHAVGILHRDLKPANVMITADGFAKILDFGLAKRFGAAETDATAAMTLTSGVVLGTVSYMAPEQTLSGPIDVRTDVFSFGVMLYEMFAGTRPFDGGNLISTIRRINDEHPKPLRGVRADVPPIVEAVVAKALQKHPQDRFQSVGELRAELRTAAARTMTAAIAGGHQSAPARDWPTRWMAIAAGGAVLVALGGGAVVRQNGGTAPADVTPTATAAPAPADAVDTARRGHALLTRYDRRENIDQAIELFRAVIEQDATNTLAHAGLAEAYYRKDAATPDPQWNRLANEHARRALALNSDLAVSHLVNGIIALRDGRREESIEALRKAADLDPRNAEVQRWLGEYHLTQDPATAEQHYRAAVALAPDDWRTHMSLGLLHFRQAKYPDAITEWERARVLSPDNVISLRNLGAVYHMADRTDDAASALQRALEIQPAATTYNNLGTLRFFQGRYADAAAAFEKAIEQNAAYYLYWGNLGDAYRWISGQEDKAKDAYSSAIKLADERLRANAEDVDLRASLASYLVKRGDVAAALAQVAQIAQAPKRTGSIYFKTAVVHEIAGDRATALRDLEAALAAGYSVREVANEAELVKLRNDARYHRILARMER